MQVYRLYSLRPKQVEAIYDSLGGKYAYRERIMRKGTGSPRFYYSGGHPDIDKLSDRASDDLRLNFEEFQNGLLVGITERTEPHILPLKAAAIQHISIEITPETVRPRPGSFFNWLVKKCVAMPFAKIFAQAGEHEESLTVINLVTTEFNIRCWAPASEYNATLNFFKKLSWEVNILLPDMP